MRKVVELWEKAGFVLTPLSFLYWPTLLVHDIYWSTRGSIRLDIPSIGIGNLSMGGSGKTPLAIYLSKKLVEMGKKVVVISSGYMRKGRGVGVISEDVEDPEEFGDEPFLIFKKLKGKVPVVVARDRLDGVKIAKKEFKPDILIFDDIYQYRRIKTSVMLLLIHEEALRKPFLLPAGPLREPINAFNRADIVLYNRKIGGRVLKRRFGEKPFYIMRYIPSGFVNCDFESVELNDPELRFYLFSGIAEPLSFERAVKYLNLNVLGHRIYRDHHWYDEEDIKHLERLRVKSGVNYLLTTEKDLIRLKRPIERIVALKIDVEIEDENEFLSFLLRYL